MQPIRRIDSQLTIIELGHGLAKYRDLSAVSESPISVIPGVVIR